MTTTSAQLETATTAILGITNTRLMFDTLAQFLELVDDEDLDDPTCATPLDIIRLVVIARDRGRGFDFARLDASTVTDFVAELRAP
jgi:hypothetical protein